jgi:hypothetical protein
MGKPFPGWLPHPLTPVDTPVDTQGTDVLTFYTIIRPECVSNPGPVVVQALAIESTIRQSLAKGLQPQGAHLAIGLSPAGVGFMDSGGKCYRCRVQCAVFLREARGIRISFR